MTQREMEGVAKWRPWLVVTCSDSESGVSLEVGSWSRACNVLDSGVSRGREGSKLAAGWGIFLKEEGSFMEAPQPYPAVHRP